MSVAGQTGLTLDIKTRPVKKIGIMVGELSPNGFLFTHASGPHHNACKQRLSRVRAQGTRPIKSAL